MKRITVAVRVAKPVHPPTPLSQLAQIVAKASIWCRTVLANFNERLKRWEAERARPVSELSEAQQHAIQTAESHGHTLTHWRHAGRATAMCECSSCGSCAVIRLRGGSHVSLYGDALNSNCAEQFR